MPGWSVEIQRDSYNRFLQMNLLPEEREAIGLQAVFRSVFPIADHCCSAQTSSSSLVQSRVGVMKATCGTVGWVSQFNCAVSLCGDENP